MSEQAGVPMQYCPDAQLGCEGTAARPLRMASDMSRKDSMAKGSSPSGKYLGGSLSVTRNVLRGSLL
eukprot:12654360-Alexandrium_andersonii.AAC.1